jgi:hypothetical protein
MNWFKTYKLSNIFYDLVTIDNYRFAMLSATDYKKMDLKRWIKLHKILAEAVGLEESDPNFLESFIELSDVFRELLDRLGHLPSKEEFLAAWRSWQKYKDIKGSDISTMEYDYFNGGKTKVPPSTPIIKLPISN